MSTEITLGSLSGARELKALTIVANYTDEETCPVWQLDHLLSEGGQRLWIHQIYLIMSDLNKYGLIEIEGEDGWYRYRLTKKGRTFLEAQPDA